MKIALAQINSCVGDLKGNTAKIIAGLKKARSKKVDLVVFPELALTGYPPEDLLLKPHFIDHSLKYLNLIRKEVRGLTAVLGFVDRKKDRIYNACALIQNREIKDKYHKIILPNYGVFDEKRYFSTGEALPLYTLKDYRFSVSICEDLWDERFVLALKDSGLDFMINISASPFHIGKIALREKMLSRAARELNAFTFYCNLIGGQDELVFDGTSKVFSSGGRLIKYARMFEEDFFVFNLGRRKDYPPKKISFREEEEAYLALRLGLSDYVKKNGFKKVIVGVSGGIDSAVVLSLAVIALGKENVHALIMPSRYTSRGTFNDAKKMCKSLGVKCQVIDIDKIFQSYLSLLKPLFGVKKPDRTEENIQARIRGNILMAFSNKFGYLVINTGNKSEVSCGYCTLYGDMVGGFGVLKDVPKLLVYKIARHINKIMKKKVIPQSTITRIPSAELRPDQKDSDSLPFYEILDPVLKLYVEGDYSLDQIVEKGFNKKMVKKIIRMVDLNEYKRRQSPVGIKISPRAFGKDRRMPITNKFSF